MFIFCPQNWSKFIFMDVKKRWKNNVSYEWSQNVHFSNLFFDSSTYTNIMCCSTNSKSILTIQLTASIKEPNFLQIRIQFSLPLWNFSFNIKQATYNNEKIWECCRSFVTATSQPDQPKYVGYILMHSRLIAGSQFFMT